MISSTKSTTMAKGRTNDEAAAETLSGKLISDSPKLLEHGVVRCKISDKIDVQKWSRELSQVTPLNMTMEGDGEYAFYRNIMDEPDFPFDSVLFDDSNSDDSSSTSLSEIGRVIQKYFGVSDLKHEIRLDDAFCVHYNMDQGDTSGAKHTDPSDITVNLCLEKSPDAEGSHVLFHGIRKIGLVEGVVLENMGIIKESKDEEFPRQFIVQQEPGYATIHWGNHPHETMELTKGKRTNIILTYCYTDSSKSDVATRNCYG